MKKVLRDRVQSQEVGAAMPVPPQDELFRLLDEAIAEGRAAAAPLGKEVATEDSESTREKLYS